MERWKGKALLWWVAPLLGLVVGDPGLRPHETVPKYGPDVNCKLINYIKESKQVPKKII